VYQFENLCNRTSFETLYAASMDGSVPVEIGDFEFFGFDMGLGVNPFGADALAFTFDLDLTFGICGQGGRRRQRLDYFYFFDDDDGRNVKGCESHRRCYW